MAEAARMATQEVEEAAARQLAAVETAAAKALEEAVAAEREKACLCLPRSAGVLLPAHTRVYLHSVA